jgi:hypothetical protein
MVRRDERVLADKEVEVLGLQVVRIRSLVVEPNRPQHDEQLSVIRFHLGAAVRVQHIFDRQGMEGENLLEQGQLRPHRSVDIDPERTSTIPDASREILSERSRATGPSCSR